MRKAAVFPVPVLARPTTSRSFKIWGMILVWIWSWLLVAGSLVRVWRIVGLSLKSGNWCSGTKCSTFSVITAALLMKAERSSGDSANRPPPRDWLRPAGRRPPPKERPFAPDWLTERDSVKSFGVRMNILIGVSHVVFDNKGCFLNSLLIILPIIYICKGLRRKYCFC